MAHRVSCCKAQKSKKSSNIVMISTEKDMSREKEKKKEKIMKEMIFWVFDHL